MHKTGKSIFGKLIDVVQGFGVLRLLLAALTLAAVVLAPKAGTSPAYSGWAFVPTILFAVLGPLYLMGLLLDMLMSGIMMSDKKGAERRRFRLIITTEALLAVALVVGWLPYYLSFWRP